MYGKIIPFGYSAQGSEQRLAALMEDEQTLLVDIRYQPYSQRPQWQGEALRAKYGTRYRSLAGVFGNRNYNNNLPIELVAPYTGWKIVKPWLEARQDLILLCACREYDQCHRSTVVEYICEQMPGIEIEEEDMKFGEWRSQKGFLPCISIQQPHAWLITHHADYPNGKTIENREWRTSYTGPLLIHAGKQVDHNFFFQNDDLYLPFALNRTHPDLERLMPRKRDNYETGGIVGICDLVGCITESDSPWFIGKYGFVLQNARALPFIAYKGTLGLFSIPESTLDGSVVEQAHAISVPVQSAPMPVATPEKIAVSVKNYWTGQDATQQKTVLEALKPVPYLTRCVIEVDGKVI